VFAYQKALCTRVRFKDLLKSQAFLEKWYQFEAEAIEKALRDWCAENGIQIADKDDAQS
jgi:hypothetical protein